MTDSKSSGADDGIIESELNPKARCVVEIVEVPPTGAEKWLREHGMRRTANALSEAKWLAGDLRDEVRDRWQERFGKKPDDQSKGHTR